MRSHTHSQEQHGAEHGQADGREHAGERAQRPAAGRLADVAELDVTVFGRIVRAATGLAEQPGEVIGEPLTVVDQRYLLADVAGKRDADRGRVPSGAHDGSVFSTFVYFVVVVVLPSVSGPMAVGSSLSVPSELYLTKSKRKRDRWTPRNARGAWRAAVFFTCPDRARPRPETADVDAPGAEVDPMWPLDWWTSGVPARQAGSRGVRGPREGTGHGGPDGRPDGTTTSLTAMTGYHWVTNTPLSTGALTR